ncbi:hypothetical protein F5880DRAFT_1618911, partial [Lentinula raphanica]
MAIASPFSSEQQEVLKTYLPGYLAKDSNSARSQYRKEIVDQILERAEFKHKLSLSIKSMGDWKTSIEKYFTNQRDKQKRHEQKQHEKKDPQIAAPSGHDPIACAQVLRKAARLFQILSHDTIDGKTFFRNEKEADIRKHAETLEGEPSACFKKALTTLWNAETNKAEYDAEARKFWNITLNQKQFIPGTLELLRALCEYLHLGKAQLMLLYSFPCEDGTLESGALEGHWDPNTPDFADKYKEDYDSLLAVWRKYGGEFCPRTVPAETGNKKYTITLDADKRPRFPDVAPEDVPIQDLRNLLSLYLKSLWQYSGRSGLPLYTDLETSPEKFVDIKNFKSPTLRNPLDKSFKGSAVFALAEFFAEHGAMSASSPFEFRKHSDADSPATTADSPDQSIHNPQHANAMSHTKMLKSPVTTESPQINDLQPSASKSVESTIANPTTHDAPVSTSTSAAGTSPVPSPASKVLPVVPSTTNQVPSSGLEAPPVSTSTTNQVLSPASEAPPVPMSLGAGGTNRVP